MEARGLSVIIPAYNEGAAIGGVLDELLGVLGGFSDPWEVLVVDDGSSDDTARVCKGREGVAVVRHPKNRGYGASLKTGFKRSRHPFCLFFDADGQFNPTEIESLYTTALDSDMATGMRGADSDAPVIRRPGKKVLALTANYLAKMKIPDLNCGYRVVRKELLEHYGHLLPDGFSASTTLTLLLLKGGFDVRFVPVRIRKRTGTSTVSIFSDGFDTLLLIVRLITLLDPLRVFLPASGIMFVLGILWGLRYLLAGQGLSIATLFLLTTGVLIFLIGLLADQVSALRREYHR
jgi:glycosyltransferase involved in cell wall biosynthesis